MTQDKFYLQSVEYWPLKSHFAISNAVESQELNPLTSQITTLKNGRGQHRKFMPYAFTRNGIDMLSSVQETSQLIAN